jgi:hypothetical protein
VNKAFDVIVVGSGAVGAAVAHGLVRQGKDTLVLEAGPDLDNTSLGRFFPAVVRPGYYQRMAIFSQSIEGSNIHHTSNLDGSTVFVRGDMTRDRKTEEAFSSKFGMSGLSLCFDEAEKEASAKPLPASFMSAGSKRILDASTRLDLKANPAAKGFVEGKRCPGSGRCIFGCVYGAKWDSRSYLRSASASRSPFVGRFLWFLLLPAEPRHGRVRVLCPVLRRAVIGFHVLVSQHFAQNPPPTRGESARIAVNDDFF